MSFITITALFSDLLNTHICIRKKLLCLFQSCLNNIINAAYIELRFIHTLEMAAAYAYLIQYDRYAPILLR